MLNNKTDWTFPHSKQEKEEIAEYLLNLRDLYKKLGHNRSIRAAIILDIREISRACGVLNNCKISENVEKIIGKSRFHSDLLGKKKKSSVQIIEEHKKTVDDLFNEFCADNFNAIQWINSCEIAYITKDEDNRLKKSGFIKNRPDHDKVYKNANIMLKNAYEDMYYERR